MSLHFRGNLLFLALAVVYHGGKCFDPNLALPETLTDEWGCAVNEVLYFQVFTIHYVLMREGGLEVLYFPQIESGVLHLHIYIYFFLHVKEEFMSLFVCQNCDRNAGLFLVWVKFTMLTCRRYPPLHAMPRLMII